MATSFLLIKKATAWGFIDLPDDRKVHTLPTPRTGGLAMVLGGGSVFVLYQALGWLPTIALPWQTWSAGFGFILVGALDDRFSFLPRQKFLIFLSLSALASWPWVVVLRSSGIPWLPQSWMNSPLAISAGAALLTFWFMAVTNAVNIEDAINGYMGGFTLIVMIFLYLHGMDTRIVAGSLIGFLILNWPRAKHFMGDAGSFGCGFFIAEGILRGGGLPHPFMAFILTVPISFDVAMGLARRKLLGMSFFQADRGTCPHLVLDLFQGNTVFAGLFLWVNAIVFCLLLNHSLAALAQSLSYLLLLIYLNRRVLFSRKMLLP